MPGPLEAYGDLDELSSFLGLLIARLNGEEAATAGQLKSNQSDLLNMGAWLATTPDSSSACVLPEVGDAPRRALGEAIDTMQEQLPLEHFLIYLNRLSDYLFVLACCCNVRHAADESVWPP